MFCTKGVKLLGGKACFFVRYFLWIEVFFSDFARCSFGRLRVTQTQIPWGWAGSWNFFIVREGVLVITPLFGLKRQWVSQDHTSVRAALRWWGWLTVFFLKCEVTMGHFWSFCDTLVLLVILGPFLDHFGSFWTLLVIFCHFVSFWSVFIFCHFASFLVILSHSGAFCSFWPNWVSLGHFWDILVIFGSLWAILRRFGLFGFLGHFGSFWVTCGQILVILAILCHFVSFLVVFFGQFGSFCSFW